MTTCFQHLAELHTLCAFQTKERSGTGLASKSELRRWFQAKCVSINHVIVKADDELPYHVIELTLFPKNDSKRITLLHETLIKVEYEAMPTQP